MTASLRTSRHVPQAARRSRRPDPADPGHPSSCARCSTPASGFWLMASIVITSLLATGAVILFAPDDELTYSTFATAIGFPMAVILPMIAILSVTSEWSQRSGLTTFTLVPHRGRVIGAKAIVRGRRSACLDAASRSRSARWATWSARRSPARHLVWDASLDRPAPTSCSATSWAC